MRPAVVSNFVTFPGSPRDDLGMFRDVLADHEESCFNVVSGEQFEQFWGKRRAWPIVKRHRYVRAVHMDGAERDTRFRGGAPAVTLCNRRLRSKLMRGDQCCETKEQQTVNRHEREFGELNACI